MILATKLQVPSVRADLVQRPRLIGRLNGVFSHRLTLISSPAGSGKTTLLAYWLQQQPERIAWLSLDPADNDPYRFISYLVAALRQRYPHLGESIADRLDTGVPETKATADLLQPLLIQLINDLAQISEALVVVLDDYHIVETHTIHVVVTFLLEHLPSQVHLVISTRSDPPLPLSRLRARGELLEIRSVDLRFTTEETELFLNDVMKLKLSREDVSALEQRIQGWIAGLQLAAHSLQGREDVSQFIHAFAGTNSFILDYLVDEVLRSQSKERQTFLLETSILDRLNGTLCERLTGQNAGQSMLEQLERDNLFVTPIDTERRWYRYHPLFADLLRHRLAQRYSEKVTTLHQEASRWHEQHGLIEEAFRHALAAEDVTRAATLLEEAVMPLLQRGRQFTAERWIELVPAAVRAQRPQLSLLYAWVLLFTGKVELYERPLQAAEAIWEAEGRADKLGQTLAFRANVARLQRDPRQAIALAERAISQLPEDARLQRGISNMVLGDAYVQVGNVVRAQEALDKVRTLERAAGNRLLVLIALNRLADAAVLQGQLYRAEKIYADVLQRAGDLPLWQRVEARIGLGKLYREWNHLPEAEQHLSQALALGQQTEREVYLAEGYVAWAWLLHSRGKGTEALAAMNKAIRLAQQFEHPNTMRRVAAQQARLHLRLGDRISAGRWVEDAALASAEIGDYLHEVEFLTAVRVWLAQEKPAQAAEVLVELTPHIEGARRQGALIELLVLEALVYDALGQPDSALEKLHAALRLAEPAGYLRLFVDEGPALAQLLQRLAQQHVLPHYLSALLDLFAMAPISQAKPEQPLIEPLTERELEVLDLLAQGATNREIADALVIALTTAKKHVSNILGKLAVANRTEAAARARELKLI